MKPSPPLGGRWREAPDEGYHLKKERLRYGRKFIMD